MNKEKFNELLIKHKKWVAHLADVPREELSNKDKYYKIKKVKNQGRELAMVKAGFKCQKCGCENNLSFHHLIMRKAKEYMPFEQYITQRNYWANIIVLCLRHHEEYHNNVDRGETAIPLSNPIPQSYIDTLKERYKDAP